MPLKRARASARARCVQAIQEELNQKKRTSAQTLEKIFSADQPTDGAIGKHKKWEKLQVLRAKEKKEQRRSQLQGLGTKQGAVVGSPSVPSPAGKQWGKLKAVAPLVGSGHHGAG